MSGPKTSRYTLTPEQRRILAEQRKLERRKAVATESIKRSSQKLLHIGGRFNAEKHIASELFSRTGNDNGFGDLINELDVILSPIQPMISKTNFEDAVSVESTAEKFKTSLSKAEIIAEKIIVVSAKNELELKADLNSDIDKGLEYSFVDINKGDTIKELYIVTETKQKLSTARKNSILPTAIIGEINDILDKLTDITDESFAKNYISVSVNPLLKKTKLYIDEYNSCHEEFEEVYSEYIALCELYYYVAQEYECSSDSIAKIKDEISRIKETVAEDDEQTYISECLDEVMTEMGYSVIGKREVTKKSGKHFRNELYTYGEGTAVNITYSSDGRIAMELGGLDTDDRVPTADETKTLCGDMEHFCDDFKDIEKRLLAKGVVVANRISLLPPDAAYAQIINTSDYDMNTETKNLEVEKQRKNVAKQKSLRKE